MKEKFLFMIGLCKKAGKLSFGAQAAAELIKSKKALLIITAEDISENTLNDIEWLCSQNKTEHIKSESGKKDLGKATGFSDVAVLTITDKNFAAAIKKLMKATDGGKY